MPVAWDRPPRILFVSASPENMTVPAKAHVAALRSAIDPWVKWAPSAEERVENVKTLLTVITDASLESIRQACDNTDYTHVHVLAHGVPFDDGGENRYAFAMCADDIGSS